METSESKKILWQNLGWESLYSFPQIDVKGICDDTRLLQEGNAFFAYDGNRYLAKDFCFVALEKKAAAIFLDKKYQSEIYNDKRFEKQLPIFFSENFLTDAGYTMQAALNFPAQKMSCVGITGTNGKTTIADSLFQLYFPHSSYLGTIGSKIGKQDLQAGNLTTPPAAGVHNFLAESFSYNLDSSVQSLCALECSSHGIVQGRVSGIDWQFLIFTNLSQDHLDFHQGMEHYYLAKKKLFTDWLATDISHGTPKTSAALINTNDPYGKRLYNELQELRSSSSAVYNIYSYGFADANNFKIDFPILSFEADFHGYNFVLEIHKHKIHFTSKFLGKFNVYNLTAVIALAVLRENLQTKEELEHLSERIQTLAPVSGRMEVLPQLLSLGANGKGANEKGTSEKKFSAVVDYAHTPDALKKALLSLQEMKPQKIITVFGCGGDRDKKKRPLMGEIASRLSQKVIVTNDNPRSEEPQAIADDIIKGIKNNVNVEIILDRKQAIHHALNIAETNDIVLVAGKGHEDYQILKTGKIFFSDQKIIQEYGAVSKY